jgi:Glycosyl transferases group 1
MRLFQNSGIYPSYKPRLAELTRNCGTFSAARDAFLNDRFGASHFLLPVLESSSQAFFTNGDDEALQHLWGNEHGLPASTTLEDILLAQIEHHRTEVFHNLDPIRYGSAFVRRLPGCVKVSIAWRAAPSPGADFAAYDRVVCNFPSILRSYEAQGWKTAYFLPAYDPEMEKYAANEERPVDVLFVGGYTRHHLQRAAILEAVAALRERHIVAFHLDRSRATRWAESPLGRLLPPMAKYRRPEDIRAVSKAPVFGRSLYQAMSRAKIVLNGAIDMAGDERGNMRCFESMGCGALMVSDRGRYPLGIEDGRTMMAYADPVDAVRKIENVLQNPADLRALARAGFVEMQSRFSKKAQWEAFVEIVGAAI